MEDFRAGDGRIRDPGKAEMTALIFHESDHEYRIRTTPVGQLLSANGVLCNLLFTHFALVKFLGTSLESFGLDLQRSKAGELLVGNALLNAIKTIDDLREAIFSLSDLEQYLLHGSKHLFSDPHRIDERILSVEKGFGLLRSYLDPELPVASVELRRESYESDYFSRFRRNLQRSKINNSELMIRTAAGGITPPFEFLADLAAKICGGFQPNRSASQRYGMSLEEERDLIFAGKYSEFLESERVKLEAKNEESYASEMLGPYLMFWGTAVVEHAWQDLTPPEPDAIEVVPFDEWNIFSIPQIAAIYRALYPDIYVDGRLSLRNLKHGDELDPMLRWHHSLDRLSFVPTRYRNLMLKNCDVVSDPEHFVMALDQCERGQLESIPLDRLHEVVGEVNVDFLKLRLPGVSIWSHSEWVEKIREEVSRAPISLLCRRKWDIDIPRQICKFDLDSNEVIETTIEYDTLQLRKAAVAAHLSDDPSSPVKIKFDFRRMRLPKSYEKYLEDGLAEIFAQVAHR